MKLNPFKLAAVCAALFSFSQAASADFVEQFKGDKLAVDPQAHNGWAFFTGSGEATISFTQKNGHGIIDIDARRDRRNIWWAAIKRAVSPYIDRSALGRPDKALRIETKIRISAAPRRVTLGLNHTRTTNYHVNLAEFDIPDTGWHVISYTDKTFDAAPSDEVFAQLSTMDAGRERYRIEIAYYKVSVVDAKTAPPDLGGPLDYRPKLPPLESYANVVPVLQDAIIDSAYPWVNFKSWSNMTGGDGRAVLAVNSSMTSLLRWDLSQFKGRVPDGWGVLELTTDSVHWAPTDLEEFGYVRVVEIKAGEPDWNRGTVTRDSFFQGKPELDVLNGQLMIDVPPALHRGGKTLIAVSPPVLQRLLSGKTKGLALIAQGEIYVSFASSQSPDESTRPRLYFNVK